VGVVGDRAGEAVGAEEVRAAFVPAVVVAGVLGVQSLECFGEARVGDARECVVVVAEQDVGEHVDVAPPEGVAEPVEEVGAVVVTNEQVPSVAAMRGTW
jgi:hypothetical protein